MYRKVITSILCVTMLLSILLFSACAGEKAKPKLSEMEDEKLIQYLTDAGVSIPEQTDVDDLREAVKRIEEDPNTIGAYGWDVLSDLHESVRNAVNQYYNEKS